MSGGCRRRQAGERADRGAGRVPRGHLRADRRPPAGARPTSARRSADSRARRAGRPRPPRTRARRPAAISVRQSRRPGVGGRSRLCWCGFDGDVDLARVLEHRGLEREAQRASQISLQHALGLCHELLVADLEVARRRRAPERARREHLRAPLAREAARVARVRPRARDDPFGHREEGHRGVAAVPDQVDVRARRGTAARASARCCMYIGVLSPQRSLPCAAAYAR